VPVGVRELRQNLSVYLARLATGTVFRVTYRGRAVALLVPLPPQATTVERLVTSGRAIAAARDLGSLGPPTGRTKRSASQALREIRADRL
jgi:antitoxin (DNA-binding transcriptional repressor) of toxin-antitoxin stability system